MEPLTFVDTNVWVYAYDASEPGKREAALRYLGGLDRPVISAQVMTEFHAVATRKLRPALDDESVRAILEDMAAIRVEVIDADLVLVAQRLRVAQQLSPWDALILAAATTSGCERIASEDFQSGATLAGIEIENPVAHLAARDDQR